MVLYEVNVDFIMFQFEKVCVKINSNIFKNIDEIFDDIVILYLKNGDNNI